jgi:DNA-binding NtrC family response regulator
VLVADDEPQLRRLMTRMLERADFGVVTAADGDQAFRLFDSDAAGIDVAILDGAITPRGAGEVVEAIAKAREGVAIVLTSADAPSERLHDLMIAHDAVFLRKPFVAAVLLRVVEDALARVRR